MIYILTFSLSSILFFKSEKRQKLSQLYSVLAIFVLSLLAALRADAVGTDVKLYIMPFYDRASGYFTFSSFFSFWGVDALTSDPLYFFITYHLAHLFPDYHVGFFVYEFIIIGFIYMALKRYRKTYEFPAWLCMLWLSLLLYNVSLNATRQMIAVSITFFATTYLLEERYKKYFLWTIIATLFHSSGILALGTFFIYWIVKSKSGFESEKKQMIKGGIFTIVFGLLLSLAQPLIRFMVRLGILRTNYLNYLSNGAYASDGLALSVLVAPLIYLVIVGIRYRATSKLNRNYIFFLMCTLTNFVLSFGTAISTDIVRMTYYFIPFTGMSMLLSISSRRKNRTMLYIAVTLLLFGAWLHDFVICGYGETYPYNFYWKY